MVLDYHILEWINDLKNILLHPRFHNDLVIRIEFGFFDLYTKKEKACNFCIYSAREQSFFRDEIPNLEVETTHDSFKLHDYIDTFVVLFSHPGIEFTPVCTTELGMMVAYADKFAERGVKLLGLSCDDVESHKAWIKDIEAYTKGHKVGYPIIVDTDRKLIKLLNIVDPDEKDSAGNQVPFRALHIVPTDKKIKLSFLYPASTGRNMDEVIRVLDSLKLAAKHKIATPVNWKPGEAVVISPSLSTNKAKKQFSQGFNTVDLPSHKDYLRLVTDV
ncbi:PREDICTED: probable 1-Cys peroxiredoxin [Ipomoea nil]|uniref:probable 1-Cys peroxiredoxin n=1 Tax=Ipomoea nil TaxID=35883 RepID=UPI000901BBA8|nr:PREDICTED: probable 1-Cys peroxiredoxin [Ipomoea nil]